MSQTTSTLGDSGITSLSVANWVSISQLFGLEVSVDDTGETTSNSTDIEEDADIDEAKASIALSTFLHYGQLKVVVSNNDGTPFTNPTDLEAQVTFIPDVNGKWSIRLPHPDMSEEVLIPTTGDPEWATIVTIAPNLPLGALLFKREDSDKYKQVGTQITKTLDPEETVYLFCNFYREGYEVPSNYYIPTDLYSLNENSVTVWWFLEVNREMPTRGEFIVKAESGYFFTNSFEQTLTFYFLPEGTWEVSSSGESIEYVGYTSGNNVTADDTYLLPEAPVGCLLVGRKGTLVADQGYEGLVEGAVLAALKDQRSLSLEPNETIRFVCNGSKSNITKNSVEQDDDIDWTFENHSGAITVKWAVMEVS